MRLGLLIPSSNTTMEPEFYQSILKGNINATLHSSRLKLKDVDSDSLNEMKEQLFPEAKKLKDADIDFMIYGCTSGSLLRGKSFSDKLIEKMDLILEKKGKSTTTSQCVLNALNKVNAHKIIVLTPYISTINELEKKFLEDNGFTVIKIKGMNIKKNTSIGRVSSDILMKFVIHECQNIIKPDALFISCTNLPTFTIIKELEEIIGCAVISSNSASFYEFLIQNIISTASLGQLGILFSI